MVPNCTFESEKLGRFTLQSVCFPGQRPPGTRKSAQDAGLAPLHLQCCDLAVAVSFLRMSNRGRGHLRAFGASGSQDYRETENFGS